MRKKKRRSRRKIFFNVKVDRFIDVTTGQFISTLLGLLSAPARKEREKAIRSGEVKKWKRKLERDFSRSIKKRRRVPPKLSPFKHEDLEILSKSGSIEDHLNSIIFRNLEYMEEEVNY